MVPELRVQSELLDGQIPHDGNERSNYALPGASSVSEVLTYLTPDRSIPAGRAVSAHAGMLPRNPESRATLSELFKALFLPIIQPLSY